MSKLKPEKTLLRAVWNKLPDCPPKTYLHRVQRFQASWTNLEYGLDMPMRWKRGPPGTVLETYNQLLKSPNAQLPTPSISEDLEQITKQQVQYVFQQDHQTRCVTVDDLQCVFCRSRLPQTTIERLHFHLITNHEHFKFEIQNAATSDEGVVCQTIWITNAEKQYERLTNSDNDERRHSWLAPPRPFNLRAHLGGDESWTGTSKVKSLGKRGRALKNTAQHEVQHEPHRSIVPQEVQEIPPAIKKKYVVPYVGGGNFQPTFYRKTSRRKVEPGELLSESDDEVDQPWMLQKQRRDVAEVDLDPPAVQFLHHWNEHLERERIPADKFVGEACVRFIRKQRAQLQMEGWRAAFEKKLQLFLKNGIIGQEVVDYCLKEGSELPMNEGSQHDDMPLDELSDKRLPSNDIMAN